MKMDDNKDLNYISSGHRAEWTEEWTNEMQWIPSKEHLNRPMDYALPFCEKESPDFRCWWNTEERDIGEKCWISLEAQRQYNKTPQKAGKVDQN